MQLNKTKILDRLDRHYKIYKIEPMSFIKLGIWIDLINHLDPTKLIHSIRLIFLN